MASSRFISKDIYIFSKNIRSVSIGPKAVISTSCVRNKFPKAVTASSQYNQRKNLSSSTLKDANDPAFTNIDLSFENYEEAYKSKSNLDLIRALMVFNVCTIDPIVNNNKALIKLSQKVMGKTLFHKFMKATFYGQFVAGENTNELAPLMASNRKYGVKSILDYSVEKDLSRKQAEDKEMASCTSITDNSKEEKKADKRNMPYITSPIGFQGPDSKFKAHRDFGDRRQDVVAARTYFYEDEAMCDENLDHIIKAIDAVSATSFEDGTGFAAVKLTSLGRPQLLLQLSEVISKVRRYFHILSSSSKDGKIDKKEFERYLKYIKTSPAERAEWFTILDTTKDGEIDLLDWHNLLEVNISLGKLLKVPNLNTGKFESLVTEMNPEEESQMRNMLRRIDHIAKYATEKNVRVMIDAEQTYFQDAINRLCIELMRKYNKDKALIFNTYQCYLKEAYNTMATDMALAEREDFYFGAKLVRGAYMEQERKRAIAFGYEDPINVDFDGTTAMFQKVLTGMMQAVKENKIKQRRIGKISVMVASHNEDTMRFTVKQMNEYNISSTDKLVCFGQLLGMCDQVSFSLGQAGYSVYKYMPYGPVDEVLPYLSRRVVENKGIIKVKKEKRLMLSELARRFRKGQFSYTP